MSKKFIITIILTHLVVLAAGIYGGMKYAQNKNSSGVPQNFQNLSLEQRQQFMQERARTGNFTGRNGGEAGTGFLNGEVIAKDEESITIKMRDNGSKIVFFSGSTEVRKFVKESMDAVEVGERISVSGEQNPDGSFSAKTVQIEPK